VKVGDIIEHTAALGHGPSMPSTAPAKGTLQVLSRAQGDGLVDYKVRVPAQMMHQAVTRVLIESSDGKRTWRTVGVSETSWSKLEALVDSIELQTAHRRGKDR